MKRKAIVGGMIIFAILIGCGCGNEPATEPDSVWYREVTAVNYSEDGCFSFEGGPIYFQGTDGQKQLICTNPDCKHDAKECPAYFEALIADAFIYNEQLYVVTSYEQENYGELLLFSAKADGSDRKKIDLMAKNIQDIDRMLVYGSKIFITYHNYYDTEMNPLEERIGGLFYYDIENKIKQIIYESEGATVANVAYDGSDLYFERFLVNDKEIENHDLMKYDMETGTLSTIMQDIDETIALHGNFVFYIKNRSVYSYDIKRDRETQIGTGDWLVNTYRSDYQLIYDWTKGLLIYDLKSEKLAELFDMGDLFLECVVGDTVYLQDLGNDEEVSHKILSFHTFLTGNFLEQEPFAAKESESNNNASSDSVVWIVYNYFGERMINEEPLNRRLKEDGYDFQVEFQYIDYAEYNEKIRGIVKNGDADIVYLGRNAAGEWCDFSDLCMDGFLYDFSDYLSSDKGLELYTQFHPDEWQSVSVDGGIYSIPNQADYYGMCYYVFNRHYYDDAELEDFDLTNENSRSVLIKEEILETELPILYQISSEQLANILGYEQYYGTFVSLKDGSAKNPWKIPEYTEILQFFNMLNQQKYLTYKAMEYEDLETLLKNQDFGVLLGLMDCNLIEKYQDNMIVKEIPFSLGHRLTSSTAIVADSEKVENALCLLNLLYTNKEYADLLIWGDEDTDYTIGDGYAEIVGENHKYIGISRRMLGIYDLPYAIYSDYLGLNKGEKKKHFFGSDAYWSSHIFGFYPIIEANEDRILQLETLLNRESWEDIDADGSRDFEATSAEYANYGGDEWVMELNRQLKAWLD